MKRYKDMTKEEKQVFSQRVQLYAGTLVFVVAIALFLRWFNTNQITNDGILPTPRKAVTPIAVTYRAQTDPAWAQDALGEAGYTMEQEGSLFCCLSMLLENNAGITATPAQLNQAFWDAGLYVDGKAVNITELGTLYPDVSFSAPRDFNGETITNELKKGRVCMVRVLHGENVHWLCVVGADEDDFLVLDPAGDGQTRRLADYQKVYALGIVK
ncbi:MAG: hypothetical protein ACI4XW_07480 [Candidatus Spyradocola sp.]